MGLEGIWAFFKMRFSVFGLNLEKDKEKSPIKGFLKTFTSTLRESNPHLKNRNLT